MKQKYIYSASRDSFFPLVLKESYEAAGSWPDDGVEVDETIFIQFTDNPPVGKVRSGNEDGLPSWVDAPPLTPEQMAATALQQKAWLINHASAVIAPLKDASDGGYIDDVDKSRLIAWQKYRYDLTKVDPAKPVWPQEPAE
ncbi:tail fiber assembly protein [Enterobacter roggenkampii]|uniref:tail fiber assembly protein n=1 Tax=Enterobacter roggenkampii TaxID=1812935 RepID=UPI00167FED08|nr:tail fiber assembly protein [Enterobacter roggenkampii]